MRGGPAVGREAHNLQTQVQFLSPQPRKENFLRNSPRGRPQKWTDAL